MDAGVKMEHTEPKRDAVVPKKPIAYEKAGGWYEKPALPYEKWQRKTVRNGPFFVRCILFSVLNVAKTVRLWPSRRPLSKTREARKTVRRK